ncbi:hypothetical protein HDU97_006603 [Phlyctochytrium planicorne]|nr:hypothetical protein HDU97_006603 [Phlyctochytrium planicorne]
MSSPEVIEIHTEESDISPNNPLFDGWVNFSTESDLELMELIRETEAALLERQVALRNRVENLAMSLLDVLESTSPERPHQPIRIPSISPENQHTIEYWELVDAIHGAGPWVSNEPMTSRRPDPDPEMAGYDEEEWESDVEHHNGTGNGHLSVINVDLNQSMQQGDFESNARRALPRRNLGGGLFPLTPDDGLIPEPPSLPPIISATNNFNFYPRPISPIPQRREGTGFGSEMLDDDSDDDDDAIPPLISASTGFWYDRNANSSISREEERLNAVMEERRNQRGGRRSPIESSLGGPGIMSGMLVPETNRVQMGTVSGSGTLQYEGSSASRFEVSDQTAGLRRDDSTPTDLMVRGRGVWNPDSAAPREDREGTEEGQYIVYDVEEVEDEEEEYDEARILEQLRMLEEQLRIPDLTNQDGYDDDDDEDEDEDFYYGNSSLFSRGMTSRGRPMSAPRRFVSRGIQIQMQMQDEEEEEEDNDDEELNEELEDLMLAMLRARYPRSMAMVQDRSSPEPETARTFYIETPEDLQAAMEFASRSQNDQEPASVEIATISPSSIYLNPGPSSHFRTRQTPSGLRFHSREYYQYNQGASTSTQRRRHHTHLNYDSPTSSSPSPIRRGANSDPATPWHHAPVVTTPDGRNHRIEDFLLSRRLLDPNGNPCSLSPADVEPGQIHGDIEQACGFDTPEGGAELLCRGLDANGDVRVVADANAEGGFVKYEEIVEVVVVGQEGSSQRRSNRPRSRSPFRSFDDDDDDDMWDIGEKEIEIRARPARPTGWHEPNSVNCVGR